MLDVKKTLKSEEKKQVFVLFTALRDDVNSKLQGKSYKTNYLSLLDVSKQSSGEL